jgi:DNA gyrase subunit B
MDVLSEFGSGNTSIVLPGGAVLKSNQMRGLVETTNRILALEKRMPAEGAVPFLDYLAQASAPDLDLPAYYLVHRGQGRFLDTEDQLEAALESLRQGGDLKIYEGPESGWSREDADVEVYALHLGTNLQPQLKKLQELGIYPDAFRRSPQPAWTVVTGDDRKPVHSLIEVAELVQKAFEKDVDIKRFKGLGEMEAKELFETTMDPARRLLHRVTVSDLVEADRIFTILMGPTVEPRREFIERHALEATNLDV